MRKFVWFVVGYPFVLLWRVIKVLFRNWGVVIAFAPAVYELFSSFRLIFVLTALASCCCLLIALSRNPILIYPAMTLLFLFLFVHLYRNVRRAYRSSVFAGLSDLVRNFRLKMQWTKVELDSEAKNIQAYEQQLSSFYLVNWGVEFFADKLRKVAKSRKPDLYLMLSWLITVIIVTVVYAFEYLGLYKIDPTSFSAEYKIDFWNLLGFSFGKITPSSISLVRPVSTLATVLAYSELFCALVIVVILVFSVLTAARERYKEDIDEFINEVRVLGDTVQKQALELYSLAMSDVEIILMKHQAGMINILRKARGLPELPPHSADNKNTKP